MLLDSFLEKTYESFNDKDLKDGEKNLTNFILQKM